MITERDAILSADGEYRYLLTRDWPPTRENRGHVLWIMLNPSTADAALDDPTIGRCVSFAERWGYDGITVVNLFALRATVPTRLYGHPEPVGERNDEVIRAQLNDSKNGLVIAAWGTYGTYLDRGGKVITMALQAGRPLHVLGLTKAGRGQPKHPLYVLGTTEPKEWIS